MKSKVTLSDYNRSIELLKSAKNLKQDAKSSENWDSYFKAEELIISIEETIRLFPTVNVQYWIGSRTYFNEVIKIGKSYFIHGRKMNKGRGYHGIKEIEEITDKMNESMLADSYYY